MVRRGSFSKLPRYNYHTLSPCNCSCILPSSNYCSNISHSNQCGHSGYLKNSSAVRPRNATTLVDEQKNYNDKNLQLARSLRLYIEFQPPGTLLPTLLPVFQQSRRHNEPLDQTNSSLESHYPPFLTAPGHQCKNTRRGSNSSLSTAKTATIFLHVNAIFYFSPTGNEVENQVK